MKFINADCEKIAVENPVGYPNSQYRKADQIIHPYYFADSKEGQKQEVRHFQVLQRLWQSNGQVMQI